MLKKVVAVAYKIQLPPELEDVHNVFHVSQLKKCLRFPEDHVVVDTLDIQDDLRYQEVLIKILDVVSRQTRGSIVRLCRV